VESIDFHKRVKEAKARANGRWPGVLVACGVDPVIVNRKNQPCPACGGTDRFQFTDKEAEGGYYCRGCGPGDAFKLLQAATGVTFIEALKKVEDIVGRMPELASVPSGPTPERMKRLCQQIWNEAKPVTAGDEVDRYLRNRGIALDHHPRTLRFHPALGYYEKSGGSVRSKKVAEYPAMVACVQGPDGHAITLHRTYLSEGRKALGDQSKKVLSSGINGAAVRLAEPTGELAVTEGIETGLAVQLRTKKPVWSAISCGNMEKLWIPSTVRRVSLYADNDANEEFAGQAAAYAFAQRLVREARRDGIERTVQVFVPKMAGADWSDILVARIASEAKAA
jgi:putative DNA primase/helicase